MENYDNKRKMKRRHLIYYLRVFDVKTGQLIGHLVDITAEGVMLISDKPIETGKDYQFRMALPSEIFNTEELIFNAHSVWCRRDVNPDFFACGLRISDISEQDLDIIDHLITNFGFND